LHNHCKKAIDTIHVFPHHPLARDFTDEEGTMSETFCPSSTSSLSDDMVAAELRAGAAYERALAFDEMEKLSRRLIVLSPPSDNSS
jgi:hypothetical protein